MWNSCYLLNRMASYGKFMSPIEQDAFYMKTMSSSAQDAYYVEFMQFSAQDASYVEFMSSSVQGAYCGNSKEYSMNCRTIKRGLTSSLVLGSQRLLNRSPQNEALHHVILLPLREAVFSFPPHPIYTYARTTLSPLYPFQLPLYPFFLPLISQYKRPPPLYQIPFAKIKQPLLHMKKLSDKSGISLKQ